MDHKRGDLLSGNFLTGLPAALLAMADAESMKAPGLRVHPHIMAATYRKGAEYHCHKDSYSGTDNQRHLDLKHETCRQTMQ